MRRVVPVLGVLVIGAAILGSVLWFRGHEDDGRSAYEEVVDEPTRESGTFCPHKVVLEARLPEDHDGTEDRTVPGEPDRLLLCRYWDLNRGKRSLKLASKRLVTHSATIRSIVVGLNDLPPFSEGLHTCPSDSGGRTHAYFGYPDEPPVVVELSTTGCSGAWNGQAGGRFFGPLAHRVQGMVPLPSGA